MEIYIAIKLSFLDLGLWFQADMVALPATLSYGPSCNCDAVIKFFAITRSAREAEDLIKQAIQKGETLPKEERFDSNCITPGLYWVIE